MRQRVCGRPGQYGRAVACGGAPELAHGPPLAPAFGGRARRYAGSGPPQRGRAPGARGRAVACGGSRRGDGGIYLADRGFSGRSWVRHWSHSYGARLITPRNASEHFASPRELNSRRQIVETVFGILCDAFRLKFPRARTIEGLQARIACKIAACNIGILINRMFGLRKFEIFNPIA